MGSKGRDDALVWRVVNNVLVVVHGRDAPRDESWAELLRASTQAQADGKRSVIHRRAILIYSLGGLPTAAQRSLLKKVKLPSGSTAPPIVLVSDSPLARGVLTAVSWIVPGLSSLRTYSLERRFAALQALELGEEVSRAVDAALTELLREARPSDRAQVGEGATAPRAKQ